MKKLLTLSIFVLCSWYSAMAQFSGSGSGTSSDPYKIYNPDQLSQVRNFLSTPGVCFKLMNNIDLGEWISENYPNQGWEPIGTSSDPFKGIFDGNGKSITGFSINRSSTNYVGLFGYTDGATIKDLVISGTTVKGRQYTGSLSGYSKSTTISNYTYNGSVTANSSYVGGVAGYFSGTATTLTVNATVNSTLGYVGGLFGQASGTITSASFSSKVTGNSSYVGGAVGQGSGITLTSCTVTAPVKGAFYTGGCVGNLTGGASKLENIQVEGDVKGSNYTGGIVGQVSSSTDFTNVKQTGKVTGGYSIGGLLGHVTTLTTISTGKHEGDITGTYNIGGVVGDVVTSSINLTACYSDGNITGTGDGYIGGICGYMENVQTSSISNCSSWGDITGKSYLGGIVGYISTPVTELEQSVDYSTKIKSVSFYVLYNTSTGEVSQNPSHLPKCYSVDSLFSSKVEAVVSWRTVSWTNMITRQTHFISSNSLGISQLGDFKANNKGEFYINVKKDIDGSISINGCSSVGNIISSNNGDYLGGIVGKDESIGQHNLHKSSVTYYYFPSPSPATSSSLIDLSIRSQVFSQYYQLFSLTSITDSYFSGSIQGGNYVGGIAGYKSNGTISNNYSNAVISGTDYVGGLAGQLVKQSNDTGTNECKANVSLNSSISSTSENVGRIYGSMSGSFSIAAQGTTYQNRALATCIVSKGGVAQVIDDNLQNGTAIGISQLRYRANYVAWGWDFNNNWTIIDTESFPYKTWQTAPPKFNGTLVSGATTVSGNSVDGGTVTVITTDANKTYTADAGNNTWSVTLSTGLHSSETVQAYAQKTGFEKSYLSMTKAGVIGSGTPDDPYLIYNAYDLAALSREGNYLLMNDIDLTSWINENSPSTGWVPVGVSSVEDSLVFDGNGHTITGLRISSSNSTYAGLFSLIPGSNSKIKNLTLTGVDINCGSQYIGGMVGKMDGKIEGCKVTGTVQGNGTYTGMLAGQVTVALRNNVQGRVSGTSQYIGGMAGRITSSSSNLFATNITVISTSSSTTPYVGGLAGYSSALTSCTVKGTVTGGSNGYLGGLCGRITSSATKCKTDVTASGGDYAGGLFGYTTGSINQSISLGSATGGSYVGGLTGYTTAIITNCYSTMNTSATKDTAYAGGITGYTTSTVSKCYASGDIASTTAVAGVVCYMSGSSASTTYCVAINNSVSASAQSGFAIRVIGGYTNGAADPEQTCLAYKDMAVSINNVPQRVYDDPLHGTSTTMDALKTQSTYTGLGWDFTSVWYMNAATGLPDLQWNKEKASQTITINPELSSMTYGAEAVTLPATTDQGMPVTWSSSDTNVAAISGNKIISKGVGSTTISYSQSGNETYTPLEGSFSFRVNKAPLTITADSKSMQEGAAVPELTVTYSGFVNNDTEASLTTPPSVTTTATSASPVGSYPITVSGAVSSNYEFTYVNGTLTVVDESADKNKLGGQDISAKSGSQIVLPIELTNEEDITALQLKLILPPHVTIATNAKGRNLIAKTERDEYHTLSCNQQNDGSYIILLYSADVDLIEGNSGSVIDVTLDIDEEIEEGVYPITLSSITLTRKNGSKIYPADATINITISDGLLGDADNDGTVDVADIVVVANYILTNGETPIAFSNADVDGDGIIDVADIVGIANIILSGGNSGVKARETQDMIDPQ